MTDPRAPAPTAARDDRAPSDLPLAVAWLVTAVAVGFVGWLLFALSESAVDRAVGGVLSAAAVLGAGLGLALLVRTTGARRWSEPLSAVLVVLGVVAAVALLRDAVFTSDLLLVAGPPVLGGVLTAALARRVR